MRKKHVIGNWKMNTTLPEGLKLVSGIIDLLANNAGVKKAAGETFIGIAPPFTSLSDVSALIKKTPGAPLHVGAQNVSSRDSGAYTGEISAAMLASLGVSFIIVGHSERRTLYHEQNDEINQKVLKTLGAGIIPVLCIGETLEERENGQLRSVIDAQLIGGLASVAPDAMKKLIIAYEPVWAIGTGKSASAAEANEVHAIIRARIKELYDEKIAEAAVILYGGSVKPDNAPALIAQKDIDGFLVGGACLAADSFCGIIGA